MAFSLLAEVVRMLIQPTPGLRRWAEELWEAVPEASDPDVFVTREGGTWWVRVNRAWLDGLSEDNALPTRREEAARFLASFGRRAELLGRAVEALTLHVPAAFEASAGFVPVPAELLAAELQTIEPTIRRLLSGKVVRTSRGDVRLETLITPASDR